MPALPSAPFFWSLAQRASARYCPQETEQDVSSPRFLRLLASLLSQASEALGACPTDAQILSAGMRSVVVRVWFSPGAVDLPGLGEVPSVILKYFRRKDSASNSGGFGYLREKHGLEALDTLVPGLYPRLLSALDGSHLLILEDVTPPPNNPGHMSLTWYSCAQLLQSDDRWAQLGATVYANTWARVLSSPNHTLAFRMLSTGISESDPQATHPGSLPSPRLAFEGLETLLSRGAFPGLSLEYARHSVHRFLETPPEECVVTSGDFSPHNIYVALPYQILPTGSLTDTAVRSLLKQAEDGSLNVRGLDAEGSCWHHPALAVAEVLLGFPSAPGFGKMHLSSELVAQTSQVLAKACVLDIPGGSTSAKFSPIEVACFVVGAIRAEQGAPLIRNLKDRF